MKIIRFWQFFTFLILFSVSLKAQNYQPFSKNSYVYRFEGTDEYYKLTVDSVTVSGDDSVFHFNPIAHEIPDTSRPKVCEELFPHYTINRNNVFGSKIIQKSNGEFSLLLNNDSFLIRTQSKINTQWLVSKSLNLTASIKSKTFEKVFTLNDSVLTIEFSNKSIIKISKNFGLIQGVNFLKPSFSNYSLDPVNSLPDKPLLLVSIPTRSYGLNYPVFEDFFNYEIGSEMGFEGKGDYFQFGRRDYKYFKIIDKVSNTDKDVITVKYDYKHAYFNSYPMDTNIWNKIQTESFSKNDYFFLALNSLEYNYFFGELLTYIGYDSINKRFGLEFNHYFFDTCSNSIGSRVDMSSTTRYTQNLGLTYSYSCCEYIYKLTCYTINNKTYGNCSDINKLLSIQNTFEIQHFIKISPNPASNEITIKEFTKTNSNSKDLIKIIDIQGKAVYQQIFESGKFNQNNEIKIDVSALQNGLYFLHYISESGSVSSQKFIISK